MTQMFTISSWVGAFVIFHDFNIISSYLLCLTYDDTSSARCRLKAESIKANDPHCECMDEKWLSLLKGTYCLVPIFTHDACTLKRMAFSSRNEYYYYCSWQEFIRIQRDTTQKIARLLSPDCPEDQIKYSQAYGLLKSRGEHALNHQTSSPCFFNGGTLCKALATVFGMIPYVDLACHSDSPNSVPMISDEEERACVLVSTRAIDVGEEVTVTYVGDKASEVFMYLYGFAGYLRHHLLFNSPEYFLSWFYFR